MRWYSSFSAARRSPQAMRREQHDDDGGQRQLLHDGADRRTAVPVLPPARAAMPASELRSGTSAATPAAAASAIHRQRPARPPGRRAPPGRPCRTRARRPTIHSVAAMATQAPQRLHHSSTASSSSLLASPMNTVIWISASERTIGTREHRVELAQVLAGAEAILEAPQPPRARADDRTGGERREHRPHADLDAERAAVVRPGALRHRPGDGADHDPAQRRDDRREDDASRAGSARTDRPTRRT